MTQRKGIFKRTLAPAVNAASARLAAISSPFLFGFAGFKFKIAGGIIIIEVA